MSQQKQSVQAKLRLVLLATIGSIILLIAGLMVWPADKPSGNDDGLKNSAATDQSAKISLAMTLAEGEVSHQTAQSGWQQLNSNSRIAEGDLVRTGVDARAILTYDDGSAIRLDAGTTIKIASLSGDKITIEQLAGSIYSRVIPSERHYTVVVDDTAYQALGTAFVTVNLPAESGIQVYQSSVQSSIDSTTITEGQQYYQTSANPQLEGSLTDIDIDKLVDDKFIRWNLAQDEKEARLKDKLGILAELKQQIKQQAEIEAELRRAMAAAAEAEKKADRQEAAEEVDHQQHEQAESRRYRPDRIKRGSMTVWQRGNHLGWGYTGKAIYGFKLVYSQRDSSPEFGDDDSKAVYVSNQYASSYRHFRQQLDLRAGQTYYITVCAFTDGSERDECVDYAPALAIKT